MGRYSPTVLPSGYNPLAEVIDQFSGSYSRTSENRRRQKLEEEERQRRERQDKRQDASDLRSDQLFDILYPEVGPPADAAPRALDEGIPAGLDRLDDLFEPDAATREEQAGPGLFDDLRERGMPQRGQLPKPSLPGAFVMGQGFNLPTFGQNRVPRAELIARQRGVEERQEEESDLDALANALAKFREATPDQQAAIRAGVPISVVFPPERTPRPTRNTDRGIEEFDSETGDFRPTGRMPYERPRQDGSEPLVQVQMEDGSIVYKPRSEAAGMTAPTRSGTLTRQRAFESRATRLNTQFRERMNDAYDDEEKTVLQREFIAAHKELAYEYRDVVQPPGGGGTSNTDDASMSDADLWEAKRAEGMSAEQATAHVRNRRR